MTKESNDIYIVYLELYVFRYKDKGQKKRTIILGDVYLDDNNARKKKKFKLDILTVQARVN